MEFRTKLAASLLAVILLFAFGAKAANHQITYQATFTPESPISGIIKVSLQNNSIEPALIYVQNGGGRRLPVRFEIEKKDIIIASDSLPFSVSSISIIYRSREGNDDILRAKVYADNMLVDGRWGSSIIQTTGTLLDITDSLSIGRVAVSDTHKVSFSITTTPISDSGQVWILFRAGFDISDVSNVEYTDDDPNNDGNEPVISQILNDESAVIFKFQPGGQHAQNEHRISLKFWPVINDTTAQSYRIIAMTTADNGEIENAPSESAPFYLTPDAFNYIDITPDTAVTVSSGSLLNFSAIGRDRFENTIPNLVFTFGVTIDSCGQISENSFQASKLGSCYITVSADGLTDSTGLITVIPGPLAQFTMVGYPSSRVAGQPFNGNVTITALDAANNRKYNYLGQLWFSTGDSVDDLPYNIADPYTFTDSDSGLATFPGAGFVLRRAGVRTLSATNGAVGVISDPVRVSAATINSFIMTASSPQLVGQGFYVNVDSAQDLYGNLSSGEIAVSDSIGGGNSPDGFPPSHNNIIVANGSGRALQVLTNAIPTMLKGVLVGGSVRSATAIIQVFPGTLGRFLLARYPDVTIAGDSFPQDIQVTAFDIFGNLKTNYIGSIYFTSIDPNAQLPYIQTSPFQFLIEYGGTHAFTEPFSLRTSGGQTISVTDGNLEAISQTINVSAASINSFIMTASSPQLVGQGFYVDVDSAQDLYGNLSSGEIAVSDSIGGGDSPDGFPPSHNNIIVTDGSGRALQVLTNAIPTMLKGVLVGGSVRSATSTIQVLPGTLGRFLLADYPDSIVAGDDFPLNIRVTVYDIFGNLKTNYTDSIYFTSSDPNAQLPYTEASPFLFFVEYGGSHAFPEPLSLRTAGGQTISITDGNLDEISQTINVSAAPISQFILSAPSSVQAGAAFSLSATNALDIWENPANGTILVSVSSGGGQSPNGAQPIFNSIQVVAGSGSANQTLFNSVSTVLQGTAGEVVAITSSISVTPGELNAFELEISSPQVVGVPFSGEALLTAFDRYGNLKIDINAALDTVVISASSGGQMTNNVLRQSDDFNQGVANLVAKGTTYNGRGGPVIFYATSQSHVTANSNPVDINAIRCGSLNIAQAILSPGDTATGTISVTNLAGDTVNVTDLIILDSGGWSVQPVSIPQLPNQLGPGESRTFDITLPIPLDFPMGVHALTAGVRGLFSSFIVGDTIPGYPDTISIEVESLPVYVSGSLAPDTLSSGSYYSFTVRIGNVGTAGLALIDTSFISFTDGIRQYKAAISAPVFLPPNSPLGVPITFDSALVATDFLAGSYQASFYYFGHENGFFRAGVLPLTDSIWIQSRATISYIDGSLNIDSLVAGQNAAFSIQVNNSGSADFVIRHQDTKISIVDSSHEFAAYSDTTSGNRVDILRPGISTFHFRPTILQSDFAPGNYLASVQMNGWQNGFQENITFATGTDSIKILSPAVLRIDSTYAISQNAPFVNTSQSCSLKVILQNLGNEAVDAFSINLHGNGSADIPDSIYIPHLDGNSVYQAYFSGAAGATPNSNEIFIGSLSGGVGVMSGYAVRINQSLDNTALLITEIPANLALSPINIISPPEALDDTIATGQDLIISVAVHNQGQADVSGSQRLFLDYGSIPWGVDSLIRDFTLDQPVAWQLTAPGTRQDAAILRIFILPGLIDINDGSSAVGPDTVSSHTFVIEDRPFITQNGAITSPSGAVDGVLSSDQTFVITDTLHSSGLYSLRGARIFLPDNFTTQDSIVKYPAENYVNWRLRAPSNTVIDTAIVQSWVIDANTGDSIGTTPDYIPITVVSAASLRIFTAIIAPPTAIDGIVEPGGNITFQAVVQNTGDAAVGSGEVNLQTTRIDMVPLENPIREFTVDTPIEWTISLPADEVSLPVPISASIYTTPLDENTGQPARVTVDSSWVSILIRELYPRLLLDNIAAHSGSVVRGQGTNYLTFELRNSNVGANFPIAIAGFTFDIVSNAPTADIFSSITMSSDSNQVTVNSFDGNTVTLAGDTVYLAPDSRLNFTLSLTLNQNTTVGEFAIRLRQNFVDAVVIENDHPSFRLYALSARGDQLDWQSSPTAILEQSFVGSLSSYPNPFNPRTSGTTIGYYLPTPSDLEIRVFTLTGELVWTKIISASEEYGTAGLHTGQSALTWDGKNDIGKEIRSGVYICIVKNISTGEEEKFKIAIVK